MATFFVLLALEVLGLLSIWLWLRARLRRALELETFLESVRREVRSLEIELNETADRGVSLVEDRLEALRGLLDEADRRIALAGRELDNRRAESELYDRLGRPRPLPPSRGSVDPRPVAPLARPVPAAAPASRPPAEAFAEPEATGPSPAPRPEPDTPPAEGAAGAERPPIRLELGRRGPESARIGESAIPPRPLRERALDLHRRGFSPEIIAARLGATVAEIELLVSLEEGRDGEA